MIQKKPTALIILDGFGYTAQKKNNAIAQANTPHLNDWFAHYPWTLLKASGKDVGLLENQMGNSEVGHMTIGSGRIIEQPISLIDRAIKNKELWHNKTLIDALQRLRQQQKPLHIMGLLSDAGIHSHEEFLYALLDIAREQGINNIVVHAFLDGRDMPPKSAMSHLTRLSDYFKKYNCGIIGSLHGRFYAMDRDHNWKRTQASYKTLTEIQATQDIAWNSVLENAYNKGTTDEFIEPTQLTNKAIIENEHGVIFINVRADRARQLTSCFVNQHFKSFPLHHIRLSFFITPVAYSSHLKTNVLFNQDSVKHTLKEVLSSHEKTIFSIAETEKYAHVTYFFAAKNEAIFPHEVRILIPSIPSKTYTSLPSMSAPAITQSILKSLKKNPRDFYLVNYANADMVGHSGDLKATIKAIECLDYELEQLFQKIVVEMHGTLIIVGDHGKAEDMYDEHSKTMRTAHTTNPVPFLLLRTDLKNAKKDLPLHSLADIAPFILSTMHVPVPSEMK